MAFLSNEMTNVMKNLDSDELDELEECLGCETGVDYIGAHLDECATTIQKIWRGSLASPAKLSLKFANELLIEIKPEEMYNGMTDGEIQWKYIDTMSPRTALIVGYCAKYADYLIGGNIWSDFMKTIKHDLWLNEFTGGRGAIYYLQVELDLPILKTRLSRQLWSR